MDVVLGMHPRPGGEAGAMVGLDVPALSLVLDDIGARLEVSAAAQARDDPLEPGSDQPSDTRGDTTSENARCILYRLLHLTLAEQLGESHGPRPAVSTSSALGGLPSQVRDAVPERALLQWHAAVAEAAVLDADAPDRARVAHDLGRLHELLVARHPESRARKSRGVWFTPPRLVEHLLDEALEPTLDELADPGAVRVCDPACGAGVFLVAVVQRLLARGVSVETALGCLTGVDRDRSAVELTRVGLLLQVLTPGCRAPEVTLDLRVGDALDMDMRVDLHVDIHVDMHMDMHMDMDPAVDMARGAPGAGPGFDVVVGNPPFLNQLERLTMRRTPPRGASRVAAVDLGPYTDLSAVFLHASTRWVRPGGRVALVQPQSFLAARDAAGVRRHLASTCALEALWATDTPVFEAKVLTCAPVLRRGAAQGEVRRSHGPQHTSMGPRAVRSSELDGEWSFLVAQGLGIPEISLSEAHGQLGDIARCTADFRDQYYGLAGFVHEHRDLPGGAPLVTVGLIEPARCLWGERPVRFQKRSWQAPVVDVAALRAQSALGPWAEARLVPKIVLATQGKVIEAAVDREGAWLPSVPVVTVVPHDPSQLWHVLALLLAPPISAHVARRYAGTGLSMGVVKVSAAQVAGLPLPGDYDLWTEAAEMLKNVRIGHNGHDKLVQIGHVMGNAYGAIPGTVLEWWKQRL